MGEVSKQKKFRDIWLNQTRLGARFGISAVKVGKKLRELGLRDEEGHPTNEAIADGYCRSAPLRDGTPFFLWNGDLVAEKLKAAGLSEWSQEELRARELAEQYIEAEKLWDEGQDKLASLLWDELCHEIKEGDIEQINQCLQEMGVKKRLSLPLELCSVIPCDL